jgi:CubicO group peptidase (beta-lactamase class C family)
VLIVRNGRIVYELYARNDKEQLRDVWSVTKSVLSALIGIAINEGFIESIDTKMIEYFPEYSGSEINQEIKKISLRHLLTMSSGIAQEEMEEVSRAIFNRPLKNEPGKAFFYNNMGPHLLSIILTRSTGLTALDFAKKYLFGPMGIRDVSWSATILAGVIYSQGGYGLRMTTRDLAKFGYLYLNNGMWEDKQIIPVDWVLNSSRLQIEVPKSSWYFMEKYGLLWWSRSTGNHPSFTALGTGGQYVYVVPDLDIVAVITTLYFDKNETSYLPIIDNFIVSPSRD